MDCPLSLSHRPPGVINLANCYSKIMDKQKLKSKESHPLLITLLSFFADETQRANCREKTVLFKEGMWWKK